MSQNKFDFLETPEAIHIFSDNREPILSLPLKESFLTGYIENQSIKDKLGSFKIGELEKTVSASTISIKTINRSDTSIIIIGELTGKSLSSNFEIHFDISKEDKIDLSIRLENPQINYLEFNFVSDESEQIFGGGEQFSHCNLKGHLIPILVEENGIGRGDKGITSLAKVLGIAGNEFTTYAPIPYFMTTKNRAFLLQNTELSELDFSNDNNIQINLWTNELSATIWQADSPKKLLTDYTANTGRMNPLPDFAYGTILGLQGGKRKVDSIIQQTQSFDNPVSAIWIQDWVGKRQTRIGSRLQWDWQADETTYPDIKNWIDSLHKQNIKILGYINPYLVEDGISCDFALANDYVVKNRDNEYYIFKAGGFNAYMIDFTNPQAYEWYKSLIKENMIGIGLDGWMADFGEWLPLDAQLYSGIDAAIYHNQYPVDWLRLNREAIAESGNEDIFIFNRSGFTDINQYSGSFWTGDQMANYGENDGLLSAVCALNSSGLSGIGINHTDIGGYTAFKLGPIKYLRDRDILYRWMEMAAFTPIFRTHEGLRPEDMIQFYSDDSTQTFFAKMANIHLELKPYFQELVAEYNSTGIPVIRHPYLEFPEDENTYDLKHQFMLGDSIMVIPTTQKNASKVKGYLPEGKWAHYFTGQLFQGENFYIFENPYGQPAAFRKIE